MNAMFKQMSLKTRITFSFVLLVAAVTGFIVIADQLDYEQVRAHVASQSLAKKLPSIEAAIAQGLPPALPKGSALYDAQSAPEWLRPYALGYHRVEQQGRWHLLVFEHDDQRYYLLQNGQEYAYVEWLIDGFGPLVILLCVLAAFWIGRRTSARVTAPIKLLADAVQHNQKPFPFQDAQDEIGVLAQAFARHSEELEHFLQRERYFVGDASHELRTPLAIISGAAETIAHQLPVSHPLSLSAMRIVQTTQEMQAQLACLLLLSRDPHTLVLTDTPLLPLVQECMARCEPWLSGKPVALVLEVQEQMLARTHAELARSVIWNLLRNACQHTEEGEVRIRMSRTQLVIADTGPGLPANINPQQFERFSRSARQQGEGLGLSLVQRIVVHLGWQMRITSSEQGCCFTLDIPELVDQ